MPSRTRCVCTINPFIHFIYGNHNLVARSGRVCAEQYRRADMQVRPYRLLKFDGASGWVYTITLLFEPSTMLSQHIRSRINSAVVLEADAVPNFLRNASRFCDIVSLPCGSLSNLQACVDIFSGVASFCRYSGTSGLSAIMFGMLA